MVNGKEVGSVVQDYNVFTLTYNGADERDPKVEIPFYILMKVLNCMNR